MDAEKLYKILTDITTELQNLNVGQAEITKRLSSVEKDCLTRSDLSKFEGFGARPGEHQNGGFHVSNREPLSPPSGGTGGTAEIQKSYENIKDSLVKVLLPEELRVFDSKAGINRDLQSAANILSKCARYGETALKQLSGMVAKNDAGEPVSPEEFRKLFTVLQAQTQFLQSEYTSLLVKSKFDDNTASLFKCFEKNQSSFTDQSLQHLRCAAEISAASQRHAPRGRGSDRGGYRGGSFYRGRGQGFYRAPDRYQEFTGRDMPTRRWNNPNQTHRNPMSGNPANED